MKITQVDDLKEFPLFEGVSGQIVFSSDRVMFLIVKIPPRGEVPEHSHPHEQMGICLQGRAVFKSELNTKIVEKGMFYWIEPFEKHSVMSLIDKQSFFLDVFNPPREEYLELIKNL